MRMFRSAVFAAGVAVLVAAIAVGLAGAGTPLPGKQHYLNFGPFCVSKSTGVMRAPRHDQPCRRGEVRIRHLQIPISGPAGPSGVQGPKGEKGDAGAAGPQGAKGETGAAGATGPKGDAGIAGANGTNGSSVYGVVDEETGCVDLHQSGSATSFATICNGRVGPRGLPGADGVSVTHIAAVVGTGIGECITGGFVFHDSTGDAVVCNGLTGAKGDRGPAGADGTSVTHSTATSAQCRTGGFVFHDATGDSVVCNGAVGVSGNDGKDGKDGVSVTSTPLAAGDANCPTGGSSFTSASGTTYACNGAKGDKGDRGPAGINGSAILNVEAQTASGSKTFTVDCPAGYFSLSGGYRIQGSVTESYRSDSAGNPADATHPGTSWTITQTSGNTGSGTAYVYCVAGS